MPRISREEAERWGVWLMTIGPGTTSELHTEPSIEHLVEVYRELEAQEWKIEQSKREIAATLMDDPYISVSKLARELGVSRPTLYSWYEQSRQQDHPDKADEPPRRDPWRESRERRARQAEAEASPSGDESPSEPPRRLI